MRLTNKSDLLGYIRKFDDPDIIRKITRKLGQLEDVEEELGVDLITLFKAIKNGVWVKNQEQGIHFISLITWHCDVGSYFGTLVRSYGFHVWEGNKQDADDTDYSIGDYGKTWALTKEELI